MAETNVTVRTVEIKKLLVVYLPDTRVPGLMNRVAHIGEGSKVIIPTGDPPHPFQSDGQVVTFTPILTTYRGGDTMFWYVKSSELNAATS